MLGVVETSAASGVGAPAGAGAGAPPSWAATREALEADARAGEERLDEAWHELTGRLLGDMHDARLVDLEARLGVSALLSRREEHDDRIAAVQTRRAAIVEMDEVAHAGDVTARLDDELCAVRARLAALEEERAIWERCEGFHALARRGYFHEDYAPRLWGRWRVGREHAALGAALAAAGLVSVGAGRAEVVEAYRGLLARFEGAWAVAQRIESRRERQRSLERERLALADAPARLHAELSAALGGVLRAQLEGGPVEVRHELARDDAEVAAAFGRIAALEAHVERARALVAAGPGGDGAAASRGA